MVGLRSVVMIAHFFGMASALFALDTVAADQDRLYKVVVCSYFFRERMSIRICEEHLI